MTAVHRPRGSRGTRTVEDLAEHSALHEEPVELIRGRLVRKPFAGELHGLVTSNLAYFLTHHARRHRLGSLHAAGTGFHLRDPADPGDAATVRAPDAAFIAGNEPEGAASSGFCTAVPDLVVEVLDPEDTASGVEERVSWWLVCGVQEVWVVDPPNRRLTRHFPGLTSRGYPRGGVLGEVPLLPGLTLPLMEVFPEP